MTSTSLSTFDREFKNVSFRENFEKEYKRFLLSELINILIEVDLTGVKAR